MAAAPDGSTSEAAGTETGLVNTSGTSGGGSAPTGTGGADGTTAADDADTTDDAASTDDAGSTDDGGSSSGSDSSDGESTGASAGVPKSFVIAVDGLRPDALEAAQTPRMDALIDGSWAPGYAGAYAPAAHAVFDSVTVSGPNHATIMTGAIGSQHGVTSNFDVGSGDFATYPHYLTLLENRGEIATVALHTWPTDALIPNGADYSRTASDAQNATRAADIFAGTYVGLGGDGGTSWEAGTDVDALFIFLDDVDGTGHANEYSPENGPYLAAVEEIDAQVGEMLDAIVARPTFDEEVWQVVLMSDHGGYHSGHAGGTAPERTIPFIVSSPDVMAGRLPDPTANRDVAPTVLQHMDAPVPPYMTGMPRGDVVEAEPPPGLDSGLLGYWRFDGDLVDAGPSGLNAVIGAESDTDPTLAAAGGKFAGFVSIPNNGGGLANASYLTLAGPGALDFDDNADFTVSLWFRSHGPQTGDPVIIGNKNWITGQNPGWLMLANEGFGNSFGTNFASGGGDRLDVEDIDYVDTDWWHLVLVFRADGNTVMYAGNSAGVAFWMALDATSVGSLVTALPLNLGQDGTGTYGANLAGDIDDLAIWDRALSPAEVASLHNGGAGAEVGTLL